MDKQHEGKKKIYISIPIKGQDMKMQKEKAALITAALAKKGYEVVNPFWIYNGPKADYWDYICNDLRALADCDAIYMCLGWEKSLGCQIEHTFVMTRQKMFDKLYKVIYEH